MSVLPKKINTMSRLNRNLALLQAGSIVTIDIGTPAGQKAKFRTTFIGYLPKKYVLIQYPDANKLGNFSQYITQGAAITVRGLIEGHEGAVVAFVSSVRQTLQIPSRIIVVSFPQSVSLHSLRNSKRIDTDIWARIKLENEKEFWKACIINISITGCQLIINNGEPLAFKNNKKIEISINNFQGIEEIKLNACICSVKAQTGGIAVGVKFNDESKDSVIELLHSVVSTVD